MKASIRLPAILFAVLSTFYWVLIADLVGVLSPLGGFDKQPYWKVALASFVPAALYAVATLYFVHWLVRRTLRQIARKEEN